MAETCHRRTPPQRDAERPSGRNPVTSNDQIEKDHPAQQRPVVRAGTTVLNSERWTRLVHFSQAKKRIFEVLAPAGPATVSRTAGLLALGGKAKSRAAQADKEGCAPRE